jgi:hypothetical protein
MKRVLMAMLVPGLVLMAVQPASAWFSWNFGTGFNTGFSCGNNGLLFGLFRGGPGPDGCSGGYPVGDGPPPMDGYGGHDGPAADFDGFGIAVGYPVESTRTQYPGSPPPPAPMPDTENLPFAPRTHTQTGYSSYQTPEYWGR